MKSDHDNPPANPANPANASTGLAPLAGLAPADGTPARGTDGRFQTGNSGGGRPKGSRNKITDLLMNTIANDFAIHGAEAVERLRQTDPANYLRMVMALVPRELILQREAQAVPDYADLTNEEEIALLEEEYRRRRVEASIKSVAAIASR
jgi:hypothetical protein